MLAWFSVRLYIVTTRLTSAPPAPLHSQFLQVFGDGLLRSLLFFDPAQALGVDDGGGARTPPSSAGTPGQSTTPPASQKAAARHARACRQLADFLGCPDEDERPRLRVLRLMLAATSTLGRPFRRALRQGPLWTALLRLATGRDGGSGGESGSAGRTYGGGASDRGGARGATPLRGKGVGGKAALGPTNVLARDVVVAVREDR